jgi:HPt (histidine-containing phosphotransfer) domain-containing protein
MDYKLINPDYLDSVSGGDPEIFNEILSLFKEQTTEIYNEMAAGFSKNNYALLGSLAHKAKSSAAIMGMEELALMLKTFEVQARDGKEPGLYQSYITRFKEDTDSAIAELEDLVNIRLKVK